MKMHASLYWVGKLSASCSLCGRIRKTAVMPMFRQQKIFASSDAISAFTCVDAVQSTQTVLPMKFRCDKSDPAEHTLEDEGLFYTMPEEEFNIICPKVGTQKAFVRRHREEIRAFNEAAFMVRRPALEVINYMKHADYSMPVQRYLLYGDSGTGKSTTLQHITHYCMKQGWLIVPTLQAWDWVTHKSHYKPTQREELSESLWNKGMFDQPVRATAWLETFKLMNKKHLGNIKTSKEYTWTKRENTDAGTPLGVLVDQGIARPRLSTDVIGCLMREIRTQPQGNLPRVLVTVDCVNSLFSKTKLKIKMRVSVEVEELVFIQNLKKLMKNTWANGAVVVAMNSCYAIDDSHIYLVREGQFTYEILGHGAFDVLDPHIPVEVPDYTDKELLSQLAYYEDRKWLVGKATTNDGRQEVMQLSCNNPWELAKVCGGLF